MKRVVLLSVALAMGALVTWMETSPGWDDTGVTVMSILIVSVALGALGPERPWLWALCVGIWIPLVEMPRDGQWASATALAVAIVGAYMGGFARRAAGSGHRGGSPGAGP